VLQVGELRVKKGTDEESIVIAGGFMEVLNNKVTILADAAERLEEIDMAAAEQARARAEESLQNKDQIGDAAAAEAALRFATLRLSVGTRRRRTRREEG
jgi:F-type H+-transporting ATPase subunit epsilon